MTASICFVGMDNYPVIAKTGGSEYVGGESVQQTLLARGFRDRGYQVSMVVRDRGQPDDEVIDDIRIFKGFVDRGGLPVVRFIHPRMTGLLGALKKADADIYFQSCAGAATGAVAWFCGRHDRRFVFRLAHDSDCIPGQQLIRFWRDRKIYEYGLRRADLISAQGIVQQELLDEHYALPSTPVNMAVELPDEEAAERDIDLLWVNNMRDFKRPDLALEVAASIDSAAVTMIGGPVTGFEALYETISSQAAGIGNLHFAGAVPYRDVNAYFARAKIFINTSDQEGFPNSYLQAWARGVPVVAFFDPDGLIAKHSLGIVPTDRAGMSAALVELLADRQRLAEMGERCRRFALENFAPDAVAGRYIELLAGA